MKKIICVICIILINQIIWANSIAYSQDFNPFLGNNPQDTELSAVKLPKTDRGPVIPEVSFDEDPISMVMQIISDATSWSIFLTEQACKRKVSLWAKDLPAEDVLDRAVQMAGLVKSRQGDVISVMTYDEYGQYFGFSKKIIHLKHIKCDSAIESIKPFLSKKGKAVVHKKVNAVVVYDTGASVREILAVMDKLDSPGKDFVVEIVNLKYGSAAVMTEKLKRILSFDSSTEGNKDKLDVFTTIIAEARTNSIILRGPKEDIDKIKLLIRNINVPSSLEVKCYKLNYVNAGEAYKAVSAAVDSLTEKGSSRDTAEKPSVNAIKSSNCIVVTGRAEVQDVAEKLIKQLDIQADYEQAFIRIYKIENTDAEDIAEVIKDLLETGQGQLAEAVEAIALKAAVRDNNAVDDVSREAVNKIDTRVTFDKSTNSVVIKASDPVHDELESLIARLDKQNKQVLIKAMIVEVVAEDNFELSVELGKLAGDGLGFTSFGISKIDTASLVRNITAAKGATAAVLNKDRAEAIIRALQSKSNARIISTPQILVNDNATGITDSIEEEPTAEINSGQTVATTSFAGYVKAGTQFAITPHISRDGYLRVEYEITLNTFGSRSSQSTLPPSRNTTSIHSQATVPDGATIIVGGLESSNDSNNEDSVPFLSDLPLIGGLFKGNSRNKKHRIIYLFITPTIIDNKNFDDLKKISQEAMGTLKHQNSKHYIKELQDR